MHAASRSLSRIPGSQTTRPGAISRTAFMCCMCMTHPPASGIACP